ncbi:MAG: acyl dehydratase [Deltaproteobacteria bacterium]|nr:acyl dehydratase [Deltaproteobacteria bacterium]
MSNQIVGGPFFEDLQVGQIANSAPAQTLTDGLAALHTAIVGDRLRLPLDVELSRRVTGGPIAHPGLVWDVAIGQSTLLTGRVIANLFYRGFMFRRFPHISDTLYTTTEVVALRQNRARPGRAATGLAVLRVRTRDQHGEEVLDFSRCAMVPLRNPEGQTSYNADLDQIPSELDHKALVAAFATWRLDHFRAALPGPHFADMAAGTVWEVSGGDVVSSAPELARLILNIAMVHHDSSASAGGRLVYGGHTIGLAAAQAARALPNLVTIVAWHSCDHLAPVREGDTLRSSVELEQTEPLAGGGGLVHLRSRVRAHRESDAEDVLDWRFIGVMA